MMRLFSTKKRQPTADDDSSRSSGSSQQKGSRKPRKPSATIGNENNGGAKRPPPSRARMTDEELVREWPYLTRKQVEEYKSMFDDLDVEGTGRITAEDIQVRLEQVGSFKTIKQIKRNLKRYDADGNGTLDFCEFLTLMLHDLNMSNPQETLRNVFLTFDEDRDGKIAAAELKRTMEMVGIPVSMREAKFVIKMADREGDGELCYDEFVDFVLGADPHPNGSGTEETETGRGGGAAEKESAGMEYLAPTSLTTRLGRFFRSSNEERTQKDRREEDSEIDILSDEENAVLT